jgi:hypothetical protein
VPFDSDEVLPPSLDSVESGRKTTITGSERAAFEKLYREFSKNERPQDEIPFQHEIDMIADEWYEEDDEKDSGGASLDSVFDRVMAGLPPQTKSQFKRPGKPVENMKTLAESILKSEIEEAKKKPREEARAEAARIKGIRQEDKARVEKLLDNAQTDRELWEILEREVFDMIRKLDLDGEKPTTGKQAKAAKAKAKADTTTDAKTTQTPISKHDTRILFPNFPSHLLHATRLLRQEFPASTLPLSVLPAIKSLGRSSYALGASTSLYNTLVHTAWTQHASYDYINELLTDMDNGGIEFDTNTLALLDNIIADFWAARRGNLGRVVQGVWSMEHFSEGAKKLQTWRNVVFHRLGAWTQKRAGEGGVIRKYELGTPGVHSYRIKPVGPSDDVGMRQEEKGVKQMWGLKPERRLRGEGGVVRGFIAGQRGSGEFKKFKEGHRDGEQEDSGKGDDVLWEGSENVQERNPDRDGLGSVR